MDKPKCDLTGVNRDISSLQDRVVSTLREAGLPEQIEEFQNKLMGCGSFDEGITIMTDFVEPKEEFITFEEEEGGKVETITLHKKRR